MAGNRYGTAREFDHAGLGTAAKKVLPAVARRLRHIRRNHPEGPFTLAELAQRADVSKRTLAAAESASGANLTIETLTKLAHGLGIERSAYFLDEQIFQQVNDEMRRRKNPCAGTIQPSSGSGRTPSNALPRASSPPLDSVGTLSALVNEIITSVTPPLPR